ncbi:acyl-CoA dehydrogenase family protein [Novosphingobium bradum]|uniref:Acyl-CoA dehydrogenase family protein n=1 Tax=Novosphingobium bradum TaxID=1737444 RepID=A0ABV7IJF2_9SPHN
MAQDTSVRDDEAQRAFRLKARAVLAEQLPPRVPGQTEMVWDDETVATDRRSQRALWDAGLAAITLPREYGGLGLSQRHADIFYEEATAYRLPWQFGIGFNVVIPTVLAHGTEEQKQWVVRGMYSGEHIWCQLLSEPSGGSDLAGVLTRAEQHGDEWRLTGSKVWTTGATHADYGICLARTDPAVPKHAGLTMFLVNLRQPGMDINPITLLNGTVEFCQEFLDDVVVPDKHRLGPVGGGWTVASTQLQAERSGMSRGWHEGVALAVESPEITLSSHYVTLAREAGVLDDPAARQLLGEAFVVDAVQKITVKRVSQGVRNKALPPSASALSSLMTSRCNIRRSALLSAMVGPLGVIDTPGHEERSVGMARVATHRIGGGTLETQLNSISERHLGLPREADPSRDVPFNQVRTNKPRP